MELTVKTTETIYNLELDGQELDFIRALLVLCQEEDFMTKTPTSDLAGRLVKRIGRET